MKSNSSKYSHLFEYRGKYFRYDYENALVNWVSLPTEEEKQDNKEWLEKYCKPLYTMDEFGYIVNDSVGLRKENWDNKEARCEYLDGYIEDLEEEARILAEEFADMM